MTVESSEIFMKFLLEGTSGTADITDKSISLKIFFFTWEARGLNQYIYANVFIPPYFQLYF